MQAKLRSGGRWQGLEGAGTAHLQCRSACADRRSTGEGEGRAGVVNPLPMQDAVLLPLSCGTISISVGHAILGR